MLSKKDKQGLWLIGGVGLTAIALLVAIVANGSKAKAGSDNCLGAVTASTVFVLDDSEEVSQQTRDAIVDRAMNHIRQHVAINERVTVFSISDHSRSALHPEVSLCRPPEEGNRLTESVKSVRTKFQNNFEKPLREALKKEAGSGKESPIAQALTDISLTNYLRAPANTLVVFSDMLENTEKFTMYRCPAVNSVIAQYRTSRQGAQERPEFKNTKVVLNLVPRFNQSPVTLKCRDKFWPWFFGNNEGAKASFEYDYLPGGTVAATAQTGMKQ
ncbi:hypothetical protein [Roseateles sp.]|uniref:hypothetical protein n=1 Tax=Roseateles sp. TaxID=1971397 RepID=UPI002869F992|nr:hypothetical protein [Roseateles sp.]